MEMKVIFKQSDGAEVSVSFQEGQSALDVAKQNNIALASACEGFCVCGTCHVIPENLFDKLPVASELEMATLDNARDVTEHSRLACQLKLTKDLDGLILRIP